MNVNTYAGLYVDKVGWLLPSADINALFLIDEQGESSQVGLFEQGRHPLAWQIVACFRIENFVYFFSGFDFIYWQYDCQKHILTPVRYGEQPMFVIGNVLFKQDKFWIFPLDSFSSIYCLALNQPLRQIAITQSGVPCFFSKTTTPVSNDKELLFAEKSSREIKLCRIQLASEDVMIQPLQQFSYINSISVYRNQTVLIGQDMNKQTIAQQIDLASNDTIDVFHMPQLTIETQRTYNNFQQTYMDKRYVYGFSMDDDKWFIYDYQRKKCKIMASMSKKVSYTTIKSIQPYKEKLYLFPPESDKIQCLDLTTQELKKLDLQVSAKVYEVAKTTFLKNLQLQTVMEKRSVNLTNFIQQIVKQTTKRTAMSEEATTGQSIHEFIQQQL